MMPGLFDNNNQSSGGGGGILQGIGGMLNPEIYRQNALEQAYRQNGFDPATARAMAIDPAAAQGIMGQRIMQQTYQSLIPMLGPQGAAIAAMHPEELGKMTQIQKVGPGEQLQAPLSLFTGGAPTSSQQQPPSSQQGPSNASVGGGGYQGPTNMQGAIEPDALKNIVDRRLTGDVEAGNEVKAGGISGMNPLNNAAFQKLLTQTMAQRGITGVELARRDAQYPAYKKATDTNAQTSTRMQLAQSELGTMLPLLTNAAKATNPTNYPIWNQARLEVMSQTGDPRSAQLASYLNAAVNMWARSITPTNQRASDTDKEHIRAVLSPYWSSGQWEAGARAIMNELNAARAGVVKNQNRIDVQFGFGKDADPNDVNAARSAISRGADKDDVTRRFEEGGFNAPKF